MKNHNPNNSRIPEVEDELPETTLVADADTPPEEASSVVVDASLGAIQTVSPVTGDTTGDTVQAVSSSNHDEEGANRTPKTASQQSNPGCQSAIEAPPPIGEVAKSKGSRPLRPQRYVDEKNKRLMDDLRVLSPEQIMGLFHDLGSIDSLRKSVDGLTASEIVALYGNRYKGGELSKPTRREQGAGASLTVNQSTNRENCADADECTIGCGRSQEGNLVTPNRDELLVFNNDGTTPDTTCPAKRSSGDVVTDDASNKIAQGGEVSAGSQKLAVSTPQATKRMKVAPSSLVKLFKKKEEVVNDWIEAFPERFGEEYLTEQIAQLTEEWRQAKRTKRKKVYTETLLERLEEKEWSLANRENTAWHEAMLDAEASILSLRKDDDGWTAKIWVSEDKTEETGCEDDFVLRLLGPLVYEDDRFRQGEFSLLGKYDRISEVEQTTFRSIRQLSEGAFELTDKSGARARVSTIWAQTNIRKSSLANARKLFSEGDQERPVRLAPGSVVKIAYQNNDINGAGHCLKYCIANAMMYLGYLDISKRIADDERLLDVQDIAPSIRKAGLPAVLVYKAKMIASSHPRRAWEWYDPLRPDHHVENPVVIGLRATERRKEGMEELFEEVTINHSVKEVSINHCVCLVGSLMFDSNMQAALPVDLAALNRSVSLIRPDCYYAGVLWSREILLNKRENRPGYTRRVQSTTI